MKTPEPRSCEVTTGLRPTDWCTPRDLNPEPTDQDSVALPIELERRTPPYPLRMVGLLTPVYPGWHGADGTSLEEVCDR